MADHEQQQLRQAVEDARQAAARPVEPEASQPPQPDLAAPAQTTPAQIRRLAHTTGVKAQELARSGREKLQRANAGAADRIDAGARNVGRQLVDAAGDLRRRAPNSGPAAQVAHQFAGRLEQSGIYLQERRSGRLPGDVQQWMRRNPLPTLLAGLGIGFLIIRAIRRS